MCRRCTVFPLLILVDTSLLVDSFTGATVTLSGPSHVRLRPPHADLKNIPEHERRTPGTWLLNKKSNTLLLSPNGRWRQVTRSTSTHSSAGRCSPSGGLAPTNGGDATTLSLIVVGHPVGP